MTLYPLHPSSRSITSTSIQTKSGRYLDLLDPRPEDIDVWDVDAGLQDARYRGQTTRPITVADHMLRCGRIAIALEQPADVVLACTMHDAGEFALCDIPGPLKRLVRVEVRPGQFEPIEMLELDLLRTICRALFPDVALAMRIADLCSGLSSGGSDMVKVVDRVALQAEALLWKPGAEDWCDAAAIDPRVWPAMVTPVAASSWGHVVWSAARDIEASLAAIERGEGHLADRAVARDFLASSLGKTLRRTLLGRV